MKETIPSRCSGLNWVIEGMQTTTALKRTASDSAFQTVGIVKIEIKRVIEERMCICLCVYARECFANCGF